MKYLVDAKFDGDGVPLYYYLRTEDGVLLTDERGVTVTFNTPDIAYTESLKHGC